MAAKRKTAKSSGAKRTAGDGSKTGAKKSGAGAKNKKAGNPLMPEVISLVTIGLGFLLALCIYIDGSVGVAGRLIQSVLRGFFGVGAYILPVAVITLSFYALFSKSRIIDIDKVILGIVLFLCVLSIASSMSAGTEASHQNFFYYIVSKYDEGSYKNGGLIGGAVSDTLTRFLGKPGSYIVLMIIVITSAMLLSGKSLYAQIKTFYEYLYGMSKKIREPEDDEESESYLERMAAGLEKDEEEVLPPEPPRVARKPEPEPPRVAWRHEPEAYEWREPVVKSIEPATPKISRPPLQTPARTFVIEDRDDSDKDERRVLLFSEENKKEKKRKIADPLTQRRLSEQAASQENEDIQNIVNEDLVQKSMAEKMYAENANSFSRTDGAGDKKTEHSKTRINGLSSEDKQRLETLRFNSEDARVKSKLEDLSLDALEKDLSAGQSDNEFASTLFTSAKQYQARYRAGEKAESKDEDIDIGKAALYDADEADKHNLDAEVYDYSEYEELSDRELGEEELLDKESLDKELGGELPDKEEDDATPASLHKARRSSAKASMTSSESVKGVSDRSGRLSESRMDKPTAGKAEKPRFIKINTEYEFPNAGLLNESAAESSTGASTRILENSRKLEETLRSFGIEAKVVEVSVGPTVTRYEIAPGAGVKVSTIASRTDDLALSLAAETIRIEAPIPGKSAVGIELPNKEAQPVLFREIVESPVFKNFPSKLAFGVGKDITGSVIVHDLARMPHLLIAGATGSGKSVCINTLIASILYKSRPEDVKLIMVDPKVVELSIYNGIPHLMIPVVTDPKKALSALNWAVTEMDSRYNMFAEACVRDLKGYNQHRANNGETDFLPLIVIIIDELADLMMTAAKEVEGAICRLAQKARACGIHLIIATQRPSSKVITGLIKANIPSRLAFAVTSGIDSRIILDMNGAEKLLGKGDMLFLPVGMNKPLRIQGGFISDREVETMVNFLRAQQPYEPDDNDMLNRVITSDREDSFGGDDDVDELLIEAVEFVIGREKASASMLQKQFRIGYNRASRLIEELEARGIVGSEDGSKPRKVLVSLQQWNDMRLR